MTRLIWTVASPTGQVADTLEEADQPQLEDSRFIIALKLLCIHVDMKAEEELVRRGEAVQEGLEVPFFTFFLTQCFDSLCTTQ